MILTGFILAWFFFFALVILLCYHEWNEIDNIDIITAAIGGFPPFFLLLGLLGFVIFLSYAIGHWDQ